MAFTSPMITLPLTIGAEVFALAALWPWSAWATEAPRRAGFIVAIAWIVACVVLGRAGVSFLVMHRHGAPWLVARAIGWAALPLFIGFPDAVCIASGQALVRSGMPPRIARALALAIAAFSAAVSPVVALLAGGGAA